MSRAQEIEADTTLTPAGRQIIATIEHLRVGLAEVGAPFSPAQESALAELEAQVRTWSA